MKTYALNSPEAMSRIIAMMIVTDAEIDNREIAALDNADAYASIGITREGFMRVARDYCSDLVAEAHELGETPLLDPDRVDHVIDCVDIAEQRIAYKSKVSSRCWITYLIDGISPTIRSQEQCASKFCFVEPSCDQPEINASFFNDT